MELSKQQKKFYKNWEKTRTSKVRYVLLRGVLFIGVIIAFLLEFFASNYDFTFLEISNFFIYLIPGSIIGIVYAHFQFKRIENSYQLFKKEGFI